MGTKSHRCPYWFRLYNGDHELTRCPPKAARRSSVGLYFQVLGSYVAYSNVFCSLQPKTNTLIPAVPAPCRHPYHYCPRFIKQEPQFYKRSPGSGCAGHPVELHGILAPESSHDTAIPSRF